ncbi:MAG: thymidine phosphorylase family protein [Nanoarchaeota archaeon]
MFKVKKIDIDAENELIAILNKKDAYKLSLYPNQRIKIFNSKNKQSVICVLEVLNGVKKRNFDLDKEEIGLYARAFEKLNIKKGSRIQIIPAEKPESLEYVKEKIKGKRLNLNQFNEIVLDIVENRYSQIETTFFVIACTINSLNDTETIALTKAMTNVGQCLNFKKNENDIIIDKHCIGGLPGNRTSMIVVPIIAAAGLKIPKSSSRAITSPAGTADTMEVLTNVEVPINKMYNEVQEINGCLVWGGSLNLSPADDLIIKVEHPLEIDSEGQMIASILSKKKSVGSTHVLIDIPVGPTAKIKNINHANKLKKRFEKIAKAIDLKVKIIITDGNEPIGDGIGPKYEALDVLKVLKNEEGASIQLRRKGLYLAGLMLEMAKVCKKGEGYARARGILDSGIAFEKFDEILNYQGKNTNIPVAKYSYKVQSITKGKVYGIDNMKIAKIAFILGAPEDKTAGLILHKKLSSIVDSNDVLFEIFTNSKLKLKYAQVYLENNIIYSVK